MAVANVTVIPGRCWYWLEDVIRTKLEWGPFRNGVRSVPYTSLSPENGVMIDFKGRSVGMNVLINVFWKTKMSSLSSVASLEEFHCIPLIFCSIFQKYIYQGRPGTYICMAVVPL